MWLYPQRTYRSQGPCVDYPGQKRCTDYDVTLSALYVVLSSWQYGLSSKPCHVLWAKLGLSCPLLKPVNKNAFEYFNHWICWLWRRVLSLVDSLCKRSNRYSRLYRIFFFFSSVINCTFLTFKSHSVIKVGLHMLNTPKPKCEISGLPPGEGGFSFGRLGRTLTMLQGGESFDFRQRHSWLHFGVNYSGLVHLRRFAP